MTDAERPAGGFESETLDSHLESTIRDTLERRNADAFVHVGTDDDAAVRYCLSTLEHDLRTDCGTSTVAVAFDGNEWVLESSQNAATHPANALATRLAERTESGTALTPTRVPHDAALYLEQAGFALASTDALERARARKTDAERDRIADAQAAASAGIRGAASLLADAALDDGTLVVDGDPVTSNRLRTTIDRAIVSAGAFPAGNTVVNPDPEHTPSTPDTEHEPLRAGEPIVIETAPRGPDGYHAGLVRTLVVDGDGGSERRAHVGATQSFRSAAAMLTADTESVTAVEADLEAEVRAFGFGEGDDIRTRASGVGLEPCERPLEGGDAIEPGSVVRLESAVRVGDGAWLRIADLLVKAEDGERATYLEAPSRSLEPSALLE
ncbi:M24 family metallopeptidase [Natronorubrum texcoconense]|uniref:Xaa-Pro aminopeptidase n=1 Tax=Natronorubrum texcoconense TaxID=1095776 RepID=A0A1G8T0D4_9EURY|nr:M24 family metallopeptidase [Natronorubrum texcoconense]SDJ34465.1 Xaa-Pro aminopeptidase [Natronorubrum texcoconense]